MADASDFAPAKVNLSLHVVGQRPDGMHLLDSIVAFADIGDQLSAAPADVSTLEVTGPMANGVPTDDANLVLKAAAWLRVPAAFTLEKHLPAAAGIGGGSSDAAAALRVLARMSGRPVPTGSEVLGADVPVCLEPRSVRMRGVGERLSQIALPPLPALLVNPGVAVPTGRVFAALCDKNNSPMPDELPALSSLSEAIEWISLQRNDLQEPAISVAPEINRVLRRLAALSGARLARMSGSGATCFVLFDTMQEAVAAQTLLREEGRNWWVAATCLG